MYEPVPIFLWMLKTEMIEHWQQEIHKKKKDFSIDYRSIQKRSNICLKKMLKFDFLSLHLLLLDHYDVWILKKQEWSARSYHKNFMGPNLYLIYSKSRLDLFLNRCNLFI